MITEKYVSFETAMMLKKAGFNEVCRMAIYATGGFAVMHARNSMLSPGYVSCPTQALAARWLREVHNIHLFANYFFEDGKWFFVTVDLSESDEVRAIHPNESNYDTYEAALEAGLQEALELIIKNKENEKDRFNR